MVEYGLQPSYVKIDYSTIFGNHSHTIPTLQWLPTSITGAMGSYVAWDSVPRDAEDMIDSLVTVLKPMIGSDSSYDLATVFNFDSTADIFLPVAFKTLAVAGTGATTAPRKACQQTINIRTTGGHQMKIVHLDHSIGATEFDKISALSFSGAALALVGEITSTAAAWSGRDNTRPLAPVSATFDLNDALRSQYRMV
jgi:hypothetical protein